MRRRIWHGAVAVVIGAMGAAFAADPSKLPYTIARETTGITAPLRADGSPDYVAAINAIYGKGVTAENNGYAQFLRDVQGTENGSLSDLARARTLQLLGITPTPAGAPVWESYLHFAPPADAADGKLLDAYEELSGRPWKAVDQPKVAAFLDRQKQLLDTAVIATKKPHWWLPAVVAESNNGPRIIATLLPSLGVLLNLSDALRVRATLRAGSGDFDGFLSDVIAAKRLASKVAGGFSLIEALIGVGIDSRVDQTIGAVAGTGVLTAEQCIRLRAALDALPARPTMLEIVDRNQRWSRLDAAEWLATAADLSPLKMLRDEKGAALPLQYVEPGQIDWNIVLKRVNETSDAAAAATNEPTLKSLQEKQAAMDKEVAQWDTDAHKGILILAMKRQASETREAYSERAARAFIAVFPAGLGAGERLWRQSVMNDRMLDVVIGAAAYKAKTGAWPATAAALVPDYLATLPTDIFTDKPVLYRQTPVGVIVYSVGPNGNDDGGYRGTPTGGDARSSLSDDITIGVPSPPPGPLP